MRILRWLLTVVLGVLVLLQGYFFVTRGMTAPPKGWTGAELLTIVLICLSVMLAVLTIFLAVLGLWGYNQIRGAAERRAHDTADDVAKRVAADVAVSAAAREAQAYMEGGTAGVAPEASGSPPASPTKTGARADERGADAEALRRELVESDDDREDER